MIDERTPAQRLLGAHVAHRAQHVAGLRQPARLAAAGQAEVGHPQLALIVDEQIRRLDVSKTQLVETYCFRMDGTWINVEDAAAVAATAAIAASAA